MLSQPSRLFDNRKGPLPLVIGVTGHRDLRGADEKPLAAEVRKFFLKIQNSYKSTPLLLLSSLAEGAERLVARVGLSLGMILVVPLPMPRAIYESDFQTPNGDASRDEFAALLRQASYCFEMPVVSGNSLEMLGKPGFARAKQYAQAGAFIAHRSQILLALWDGHALTEDGSPAQVVDFKKNGIPEHYRLIGASSFQTGESGVLYHIVTPRVSNSNCQGKPFKAQAPCYPCLLGEGESQRKAEHVARRAHKTTCRQIEKFNRDALYYVEKTQDEKPVPMTQEEGDVFVKTAPEAIGRLFRVSDELATTFKGRGQLTLPLLFILACLAAIFFNISYLRPQVQMVQWGYGVFFALTFVVYYWARYKEYHRKHLDYRTLAEGLRLQLFWQPAGLPHWVGDYYERAQRSNLEWVRAAVWFSDLIVRSHRPDPAGPTGMKLALQWIAKQKNYYKSASRRDCIRLWCFQIVGYLALVIGASWIGFRFFLGVGPVMGWQSQDPASWVVHTLNLEKELTPFIDFLGLLIGLGTIVGGLLFAYVRNTALAEHVGQFRRMWLLFCKGEDQAEKWESNGETARAKELVVKLAEAALMENGDWLLLHQDRPLESPNT